MKNIVKINKIKEEKGSATLLVLITLLFFMIYLGNLYIIGINKVSSQNREINKVQEAYKGDFDLSYEQETLKPQPIISSELSKEGKPFSREYGIIDVSFLEGNTYKVGNANKPVINDQEMVPINWNGTNWIVTNVENWDYSYDEVNKKWANVTLRDGLKVEGISDAKTATISQMNGKKVLVEGSMFVWIPRYAYRIRYLDKNTKQLIGYSDARGFVDDTGRIPKGMVAPVTSIPVGSDLYRTHPCFEDGSINRIYTRRMG